jgi:hypothetical protein
MFEYTFDSKLGAQSNNQVYDLYGVINHIGNSLYSGHYTAFCRTHDSSDTTKDELGWRLFDDSRVVSIKNEEHVITPDAYVLMYRLRSNSAEHNNSSDHDLILNNECSNSTALSQNNDNSKTNTLNGDNNLPNKLSIPHLLMRDSLNVNIEREQETEILQIGENELSLSSSSSSSPSEQIDENDDRELDFFNINNELNKAFISPIVRQEGSLLKRFTIDDEKDTGKFVNLSNEKDFTNLNEMD